VPKNGEEFNVMFNIYPPLVSKTGMTFLTIRKKGGWKSATTKLTEAKVKRGICRNLKGNKVRKTRRRQWNAKSERRTTEHITKEM